MSARPCFVWGWQVVGAYTRLAYVVCNDHATRECRGERDPAQYPIDADTAHNEGFTCETPGCGRALVTLARTWVPPDYPDECRGAEAPMPEWQIEAREK